MFSDSRLAIYDYVEALLTKYVTENVYLMEEPQELLQSDTEEGFIVIKVGELNDASEFQEQTFGWARVFVTAYIPPITRGRLNKQLYADFENKINTIIKTESRTNSNSDYWIDADSVISMDNNMDSNANNAYYLFVKSFVVFTDKITEQENNS